MPERLDEKVVKSTNFALRERLTELTVLIQKQAVSHSVKAEGPFKRGHYQC